MTWLKKLAAVYIALATVAFFVVCFYNIWTPGCSFECYSDDKVDVYGQNLVSTWFLFGLIGSVVVGVVAVFCDDVFDKDE